jgi:hypothetical protein
LRVYAQLFVGLLIKTMQHISDTISPIPQSRGGRSSSPDHRTAQAQCEDFTGLEADTKRYDLLLLVKRAGKLLGFTPRMVELLDYYMAYTRDIDWGQGARPIVYQSLSKTALDLGVSERHIQRLEQQLFEIGALSWNDSGNHRRYGQRDAKTGAILYAFGADLTPLAYFKAELEEKQHEKQLHDAAWMETKRQISWHRRQICALLGELEAAPHGGVGGLHALTQRYEVMAGPIRTYMGLEILRTLLETHKALHEDILAQVPAAQTQDETNTMSQKESSTDDSHVVTYKYSTQEPSNKLDTCKAPPKNFQEKCSQSPAQQTDGAGEAEKTETPQENLITQTGLQHITLKQTLNAASDRFRAHIPLAQRAMSWMDIIEAAYRIRSELHISQQFWAQACSVLGRSGAAICVLLTDQATQRAKDPVTKPAAYFKAMIGRAHSGDLHLHKSIFGILKQGGEEGDARPS